MELEQRLDALAGVIGQDMKTLITKQGDLSALSTSAKNSLVAALNELHALIGNGGGAAINDSAGAGDTAVTYSADKILSSIETAVLALETKLLGDDVSAALDTLSEFADAINNDPSFAATVATALGQRLRVDAVQNLTTAQKLQGCQNLGLGNPDVDLVAAYNAAKA